MSGKRIHLTWIGMFHSARAGKGNILLNGVDLVTISIGYEEMTVNCDEASNRLRKLPGVVNIEITGRS